MSKVQNPNPKPRGSEKYASKWAEKQYYTTSNATKSLPGHWLDPSLCGDGLPPPTGRLDV